MTNATSITAPTYANTIVNEVEEREVVVRLDDPDEENQPVELVPEEPNTLPKVLPEELLRTAFTAVLLALDMVFTVFPANPCSHWDTVCD